jgi:hypothetical protein
MIIRFDNFLKEYVSYRGPKSTIGFRYSEPDETFSLLMDVNYNPDIVNILSELIDKYSIPAIFKVDNSEYSKGIFSKKRKMQKITFLFNSYSGFEAHSIIDTIVNDLNKSGIQMLSVRSSKNVKQVYSQGFVNPNDNIQPSVRVSNPIGFRR